MHPSWINGPRARGWAFSRTAKTEPWAVSVLQAKTLTCSRGHHAFRRPLLTGHNHGAKSAPHARCAQFSLPRVSTWGRLARKSEMRRPDATIGCPISPATTRLDVIETSGV